jgi:hypothetical protein
MNACAFGPEKDALNESVKVFGEFIANKDYLEYGRVRSVEEITESLKQEGKIIESNPNFTRVSQTVDEHLRDLTVFPGFDAMLTGVEVDTQGVSVNRANAIVDFMIRSFSDRLGIPYEFVSRGEAFEILKQAGKTYTQESGFFIGGKVYLIREDLSLDTAMHEFAHPFVRAIQKENPELFDKLYNDLINTETGRKMVSMVSLLEDTLDPSSDLFKEEVVVRALAKHAYDKINKKPEDTSFFNAIKNFLYNLKQLLRKYLGKTYDVSKLDSTTTLDELSEIFLAAKIDFQTESVNQTDIVAFKKDLDGLVEELANIMETDSGAQAVSKAINDVYRVAMNHKERLEVNKNLKDMAELLKGEFDEPTYKIIINNLRDYESLITDKFSELVEKYQYNHDKAKAYIETLYQIKHMARLMVIHMNEIRNQPQTPEITKQFFYYRQLATDWANTISNAREMLNEEGLDTGEFVDLITSIEGYVNTAINIDEKFSVRSATELLTDVLDPLAKEVERYYNDIIDELVSKGASPEKIERYRREFKDTILDKQALKEWLTGQRKDTNVLSAWMESYMNIQDPVVFGLAQFINNNISDVLTVSQQKHNKFATEFEPLLQAAGIDIKNLKALRDAVTYVEKDGIYNEKGEYVQRDRYAFKNHLKDYRYEIGKINDEIRKAEITAQETGDSTELDKLKVEREKFLSENFHDSKKEVVRNAEKRLVRDEIGEKAYNARDLVLRKIKSLDLGITDPDELIEKDRVAILDSLWREYNMLFSLSYADGTKKDPSSDDYKIAVRLREYREETKEFYEWVPVKNMFSRALASYEQQLKDNGITGGEFIKMRADWIKNNTRVKIKPEFWEKVNEILEEIRSLKPEIPDNLKMKLDLDELYADLTDQMSAFRDDDGQPDGLLMSEKKKAAIKELDKQIEKSRKTITGLMGLSTDEQEEYDYISALLSLNRDNLSEWVAENPDLRNRYEYLQSLIDEYALNDTSIGRINILYKKLNALRSKEATSQYIDAVNELLKPGEEEEDNVDVAELFSVLGIREFDASNIDKILDPNISDILRKSPKFDKWFRENHYTSEYTIKKGRRRGTKIKSHKRISAWNVNRPNDPEYYESTEITDKDGNVIDVIQGIPTLKYYRRSLKSEYRTEKITMAEALRRGDLTLATVDEVGRWLPKPDSKFRNDEYYRLKNTNPAQFNLANKMLQFHLENQEGLSKNSRLGVFAPRFRKDGYETLTEGTLKDKWDTVVSNTKATFAKAKDDLDLGYNAEADVNYVTLDMFDSEVSGIPIAGKADLELAETSEDMFLGVMRYMQSAERHKKLVEINPQVRAIQKVVNGKEGALKDMTKASKSDKLAFNQLRFATKKEGTSVRAQAINSLIEREFEGKTQAGVTADMAGLNKFGSFAMGLASTAFFALDITSALKNSFGQTFQSIIESAGGQYLSPSSLAKGAIWAQYATAEISFEIYKYGPKGLNVQIYEMFDPEMKFRPEVRGYGDKFGTSSTRTLTRDILKDRSWLTNFRVWTQLNATMQLFGGVMHHQMVDQTINGVTKQIPYMEAFEIKDGQLTVKEGVSQEWAPGGSKFKMMQNRVQAMNRNLNGAFSQFDTPMGGRYLLWRMITFLKKWFANMFLNRFGYRGNFLNPQARWDVQGNQMRIGYYIQSLNTMVRAITTLGKDTKVLTKQEKASLKKTAVELLVVIGGLNLMLLLFDYDPDDEERYEKLRRKSGPLPGIFTADSEYEYNTVGFMENHALFLLKSTLNEQEAMVPIPGLGLDDYGKLFTLDSIALTHTVENTSKSVAAIVNLITNDPSAYYKRDAGPFEWQQQEDAKVLNYILKSIGLSGKAVDPVNALKNFESAQSRFK